MFESFRVLKKNQRRKKNQMIFRLRDRIAELCQAGNITQAQKRHYLMLMKALFTCLPNRECEGWIYRDEKEDVSDQHFCKIMTNALSLMYVPLNTRNIENKLRTLGLTIEDLNFDRFTTQSQMVQQLQMLAKRTAEPKNESFYDMIVSFAYTVDREDDAPRVTLFQAFTLPAKASLLIQYPKWTTASLVIFLGRIDDLENNYHNYATQLLETTSQPNIDPVRALAQIYSLISRFNVTPATESWPYWTELDTNLSVYYAEIWGNRREGSGIADFLEILRNDHLWNVIHSMYDFHDKMNANAPLKPIFPFLSGDLMAYFCLEIDCGDLASQWSKLVKGLISRIWFTKGPTNVQKLRIMIQFFPTPYTMLDNNFISTLFPSESCFQLNAQFRLHDPESVPCGCNCVCSTYITLMIANEVGLLGKEVHLLAGPKHMYLAVGDRERDWHDRKYDVIETTERQHDSCPIPLRKLIDIDAEQHMERNVGGYRQYTMEDHLVPNFAIFYLWEIISTDLGKNEKTNEYLQQILQRDLDNFFGAEHLIGFLANYPDVWKINWSPLTKKIQDLAKQEMEHATHRHISQYYKLLQNMQKMIEIGRNDKNNVQRLAFMKNIHGIIDRLRRDPKRRFELGPAETVLRRNSSSK